jgi:hypothetical protein
MQSELLQDAAGDFEAPFRMLIGVSGGSDGDLLAALDLL